MQKRRAIIHIGTAKTGTTTIQRMLLANRERLPPHGFAFPASPGEKNHFRLAIYAGDSGRTDKMARNTGEAGDSNYVAERLESEFRREMEAMPASVHTCVFSNEHCYRKISTPAAAARLKALFDPYFDRYEVIAYLRRQDEMAVSVYSTRLRSGSDRAEVLPDLETEPQYLHRFDWAAMLDRWAEPFGRDAVRPRLFGREHFVGGDLLADFRAACGMADVPGLEHPETKNSALSAAAQEFLRRLNLHIQGSLDEDEEEGKAPQFVRQFVDAHHAGRGRRPSRAEAARFVAAFAPSNERLRATYFPQRAEMFPDDVSRYPEDADPVPTEAEVLEVALSLIAKQAEEAPGQIAETAFDRARKRQASGAMEEARRLYTRALVKEPAHAGALRGLFELAETAEAKAEAAARLKRGLAADPEQAALRALAEAHGVALREGARVRAGFPVAEASDAARDARREARREERRKGRQAEGKTAA